MIVSVTLATPTASSATELQSENELLLELRLDGNKLGLDILGYQRGNDFLLSLEELVTGLEFPISVDGEKGRASGWYISPERGFSLDMKRAEVISGGKSFPLGGDEVVKFEGGLYVETKALERWFPLRLSAVIRQLYLNIEPTELLPIQARQQRRELTTSQPSANTEAQYALQENPYQLLGPHITKLRLGYSTLRQNPDSDASYDANYALLSRGDLAWMTSTISLAGKSDDSLTGASLKLERTAFDGPLLLNHVEVGDLGVGGFRGILLRGGSVNRALGGRFEDETVNLEGSQLPDWDVELYQNGQLIDKQTIGQDGRYLFEDVSLLFGENHFELKFYGPYGEVESRDEYHFLGANMLAPGRISYDLSAMQEGRTVFDVNEISAEGDLDSEHYTADFNLGLSNNLTIGASVESLQINGERVDSGSLGFGLATSYLYGSVRYHYEPLAQDSISSSLRTKLGESGINLSYTQYMDEPELVSSPNKWQADLAITSSLFEVPVNFGVNQQEQQDSTQFGASLGTTIALSGTGRFSTSLWYDSVENRVNGSTTKTSQTGGQSSIYSTVRPWTFRLGTSYSLEPKSELLEYSAQSSLRMDRDTTLHLDVKKNETTDLTYYQGGVNWLLDSVQISARVGYDSDERWAGFITLSTSLVDKPGKLMPILDSRSSVGMGSVEVQVVTEPEAEPHEGVTVKAVQAWRKAKTDENGIAYLSRMPSHQQTDIVLDESTISDSELRSTKSGVSVIPRPGSYSIVKFPMIRTAELEGHVVIADGKDRRPVSRVLVMLKNADGKVVTQRRSAFDGFFLFDGIEPGVYQITLEEPFSSRLLKKPANVKVSSNSGVIRDLNFILRSAPVKRIMQDRPWEEASPLQSSSSSSSTLVKGIIKDSAPVMALPLQSNSGNSPTSTKAIVKGKSSVKVIPLQSNSGSSSSFAVKADDTPAIIADDTASELDSPPQQQVDQGSWFVQLVAFRSVKKAENFWQRISKNLPALKGKHPKYQQYGDLTRLLVGPGQSKQAAQQLCQKIKQSGQSCFVQNIK